MSEYANLKKQLAKTPYLTANVRTGTVELITEVAAFKMIAESNPFLTRATLNLKDTLESFAGLTEIGKDDRVFSLSEIAKVAGLSYHVMYQYVAYRKILSPSIQPFRGSGQGEDYEAQFSWRDCFLAGLIGCLQRNGLKPDQLKKVAPLFDDKKRTTRKRKTSTRS